MLDIVRLLAAEFGATLIQPKLHQIKADFKLALVTGFVIALFSLLGMACLFVLVFLSVAQATSPQEAALVLFGACVVVCLGAIAAHAIGRNFERRLIEDKFDLRERPALPEFRLPDFHVGQRAKDAFADNKLPALLAIAGLGLLFGARPGASLRTASKVVLGRSGKSRRREAEDREYRRSRR